MLDDVDVTGIISLVYVVIFIVGIFGIRFFIKKKIITGAIFWASLILNILFYLYLMGNYRLYPKFIYLTINKYWPWINLILLVILIIGLIKNKYAKKENI